MLKSVWKCLEVLLVVTMTGDMEGVILLFRKWESEMLKLYAICRTVLIKNNPMQNVTISPVKEY